MCHICWRVRRKKKLSLWLSSAVRDQGLQQLTTTVSRHLTTWAVGLRALAFGGQHQCIEPTEFSSSPRQLAGGPFSSLRFSYLGGWRGLRQPCWAVSSGLGGTTTAERKEASAYCLGAEDKHDAVGTSLERVSNAMQDHQHWSPHCWRATESEDEAHGAPDPEADEDEWDEDQLPVCHGGMTLKLVHFREDGTVLREGLVRSVDMLPNKEIEQGQCDVGQQLPQLPSQQHPQ